MNKKNLIEIVEYEVRWYYRIPALIAIAGVFFAVLALIKSDNIYLLIGGVLFFNGLGIQLMLGFDNFSWKNKKRLLRKPK